MKVIEDQQSETINSKVRENVIKDTKVITDGFKGYNNLDDIVTIHKQEIVPPKKAHKILPWVHISIGNAKRLLLNVYHRIDGNYLQSYLNEFCYKFNRRYIHEHLFERLLVAGVSYQSTGIMYKKLPEREQ